MTHDEWQVELEAFLDGELSPAAAEAFQAATKGNTEREAELESRLRFRALARAALGGIPAGLDVPVRRPLVTRRVLGWATGLAAAAAAAWVLLSPSAGWRESTVVLVPRPEGSTGLVSAPRLGEQAGQVVVLNPGRLVLPDGSF